jgi:hypothetical protein
MLQQGSHKNSKDYRSYKAVFEEIENINFNKNNNLDSTGEKIGAPAQGPAQGQ